MADPLTMERVDKAYIFPIRTVLAVDDDFSQYGVDGKGAGHLRAKALWSACRNRGLLCDVDDASDLIAGKPHEHLLKSDLVILDYHLDGENPDWALNLLVRLAESDYASQVVVYTHDDKLLQIRRRIAAHLRGTFSVSRWLKNEEEQAAWDTFESKITFEPPETLVDAFISGNLREWRGDVGIRKQLEELGVPTKVILAITAAILEKAVRGLTSREAVPGKPCPILGKTTQSPWVYASNLFVVCVQKTKDNEANGELVFEELRNALCDWNPDFMLASVAFTRGEFARGGFDHERSSLSDPSLQAGWLYHAWAGSAQERDMRLRVLFERIIRSYAGKVLDKVIAFGSKHVPENASSGANLETLKRAIDHCCKESRPTDQFVLHVLNEYLALEDLPGYVETGTLFATAESIAANEVYLCVTPACDLVPRKPSSTWQKQVHPHRPIIAMRCKIHDISEATLTNAELSKYIYLKVDEKQKVVVLLDATTGLPHLEWFIMEGMGKIATDKTFGAISFTREDQTDTNIGEFKIETKSMRVIGQVRAIYANRIMQVAGQYMSRIGVDFVNLPTPPGAKKTDKAPKGSKDQPVAPAEAPKAEHAAAKPDSPTPDKAASQPSAPPFEMKAFD
jgi:hypothetical protein